MKRTIISIFSFFLSILAFAGVVGQDKAAQTASKFFSGAKVTLSSSTSTYFAFDKADGGWVIISADDCIEPVLAYSDKGHFCVPKANSNVKVWMDRMDSRIVTIRKSAKVQSNAIKARWNEPRLLGTKAGVEEHLLTTAAWDQGSPYNDKCPKQSGKATYTGCVATAMSIVLRYNEWPQTGTGTIPAYTTSGKISVPSINISGFAYNLSTIPLTDGTVSSEWTDAQKTAVASLMYHCGAMVQMEYTSSGSGAYSSDIINALSTYMSYLPTARELYRSSFDNQEWFDMIKKEIDANYPIIYGGGDKNDDESGHQFVLDGYNSNNYVHINWGWGGENNAWYAVSYLGSDDIGYVFSDGDSGIFGLRPNKTSATVDGNSFVFLTKYQGYNGLELSSGTIAKGGSFTLKAGYFANLDYYFDYNGSVKACLVGKDGNIKEDISSPIALSVNKIDSNGNVSIVSISSISCTITKDIVLGDYIAIYYKLTDGTWAMVSGDSQAGDNYDEYTVYNLGVKPHSVIRTASGLKAGQAYYPSILYGYDRVPEETTWYFDDKTISDGFVKLTAGDHTIKAVVKYSDSSTETIQREILVD